MSDFLTFVVAPVLGIIAIVSWSRSGQPVIANLGFRVTKWSLPDFLVGFAITFLAILTVFLVEFALGAITVTGAPDLNAFFVTMADLAANAMVEEIFFRSFLLSGLVVVLGKVSWGTNRWVPVLISAAVFGLVHLTSPNASPVSVFGNALGGLIYGVAFLGARNIWFPFGLHLGWNFTQALLGLPVSGKSFPGLFTVTATRAGHRHGRCVRTRGGHHRDPLPLPRARPDVRLPDAQVQGREHRNPALRPRPGQEGAPGGLTPPTALRGWAAPSPLGYGVRCERRGSGTLNHVTLVRVPCPAVGSVVALSQHSCDREGDRDR